MTFKTYSFRTVFCFAAVALAAWLALPKLKVDLLPQENSPVLTVSYSLPNSSPDIVEQQVSSILEGAFSQLSQLKNIKSVSNYNNGRVELYFDKSSDMQFKRFETAAIIRQFYPSLPANVSYPIIAANRHDNVGQPLLVYAIYAPLQPFRIKQETEDIFRKAFAGLGGIKEAKVSGVENLQLTIRFDEAKCNAWHVRTEEIIKSLQSFFSTSYPGEFVTADGAEYFMQIPSPAASVPTIENLDIPAAHAQFLRLKDVAQVYMEEQEPSAYFRINGKNAVSLSLFAREGENKIAVGEKAKALAEKIKLQLPRSFEVRLTYDDTEFFQKELRKNYFRTGLSMLVLIVFLLLAYRSGSYLLTLLVSLLISLCLAVILAWCFRVDIHLYTLAGLAISFGIIIDNAIVMLDYYRHWRSRKIFLALLAANLTTIAALCLVFFLPEEEKKNLMDFSIVVILTLVSSLLTTLWFMPSLYELVKRPATDKKINFRFLRRLNKGLVIYFSGIRFLGRRRKIFIAALMLSFGLPVFMLPAKWEGQQWYNRWYNASVGCDFCQENIKPTLDKYLGGALRLFVNGVYENSGYRDPAKTKLLLLAEMPYGNTPDQLNYILSDFEKYLSAVEGVKQFVTHIADGQHGHIEISFDEAVENSELPFQLKSHLIARALDWGGVEWRVLGVGQGFSNSGHALTSAFRIFLRGYNYDQLEHLADRLAEKLIKNKRVQQVNKNEQLEYWEKPSREYVLSLDAVKTALHNTNRAEILNKAEQLGKPMGFIAKITVNSQFYPVMLKEKNSEKYSGYDLLRRPLYLDSGRMARAESLGKLALQITSANIRKEERQYIRMLGFEYIGSMMFGAQFLDEIIDQTKKELPVGYSIEEAKWTWWGEVKRKYGLIFALLLVVFFIGCVLFENMREAVLIISIIPISFIGLFLIFSMGHFYFDQGGYAAFILLGGLVSNAAIFIINDYNNLKKNKSKRCPNRLLIRSAANRARTIMLTTLSACCGLIPFLAEGQNEVFWFSLAIGAIGGLLFSLVAAFIVLPVLLWKK